MGWGSVLTIIIWLGASVLFVWYAANFGSYNKTYGSLPAIIGFMTWNLAVQHRGSDRRAAQR